MIELYHNDMSVCAQKVRLVLAHKKIAWKSRHFNLRAGEQFTPEFLKINPKAVIPVLVHDGAVITESNVICYYLDEVFKELRLMPDDLVDRAQVRVWLTRLDAGLHEHIAVISFCLAFRQQILTRYATDEALESFFKNIPDTAREVVMRDMVINGTASPRLKLAIVAYKKLLADLATALKSSEWIIDSGLSLADFAYLPYVERLEQLQLTGLWTDYPQIENWLQRVRKTSAYQVGMQDWHNLDYIKIMTEADVPLWVFD
ncbi:glutathione S-transferase family protein [Paraglaciecola chathamensis]|uniref:Glutathione S-transferase family protein n=1 Tax=Paraglaciecola chathamensis TaxID=368405 RepID=A0ABS0WGS2_9ALTE|nr:glutathione S-transferase family protein [Paraglaciecola chathamensis]MBJ2137643.1 glutathione S-transferase family protein [Paraglaciecola chathamensis]|tara:strand:- start:165 stop:941 length:777 start_codon:yes stop_codon:yes gene_type:complete